MSAIQEADTENPAAAEESATDALANTEINFSHPNKVPQVMNEVPSVSDDEDDEEFDINKADNTEKKVNAEEAVEDE